MERRKEPRMGLEIPVSFTENSEVRSGRVTSLSMGGFRVSSFPPLPVGTPLKLSVQLPDEDAAIEMELASVRWSDKAEFGASTMVLEEESRDRLREFLGNNFQLEAVVLETRSGPKDGVLHQEILNPAPSQEQRSTSLDTHPEVPSSAASDPAGSNRRMLKRMSVGFPIRLVGDLMNKKGVVVDLSSGGCAIQGHEGLKDAKYIGLTLCVPGTDEPIKVELAMVRWVGDNQAGLEFVKMNADQRKRLHTLIQGLEAAPGPQAA